MRHFFNHIIPNFFGLNQWLPGYCIEVVSPTNMAGGISRSLEDSRFHLKSF